MGFLLLGSREFPDDVRTEGLADGKLSQESLYMLEKEKVAKAIINYEMSADLYISIVRKDLNEKLATLGEEGFSDFIRNEAKKEWNAATEKPQGLGDVLRFFIDYGERLSKEMHSKKIPEVSPVLLASKGNTK